MATIPIKYRISSVAPKPTTDSVKSAPLTSLEIDGNFRSIKDSFSEETQRLDSLIGSETARLDGRINTEDSKIEVQKTRIDNIVAAGIVTSVANKSGAVTLVPSDIGAQSTLVSGTNIKTINGNSLLGSGNLVFDSGIIYSRKTSNYLAVDRDGIIADTSGAAFTVTLPASPTVGMQVHIIDGADWTSNNLTVDRNGSTIEDSAQNLVLNVGGSAVLFVYSGSTWQTYIQVEQSKLVSTTNVASLTNKTLISPVIDSPVFQNDYTEETWASNTGSNYTINLANGTLQILTLTANCVYTFPTPIAGKSFTLIQKQDAVGSRSVTWPSSVKWPSGLSPVITSTANRSDKFVFTALDGSTWIGSVAGLNYAA